MTGSFSPLVEMGMGMEMDPAGERTETGEEDQISLLIKVDSKRKKQLDFVLGTHVLNLFKISESSDF